MTVHLTDGRVASGVSCPDQWGAVFRDLPIARNRSPHARCGTDTRGRAAAPLAAPGTSRTRGNRGPGCGQGVARRGSGYSAAATRDCGDDAAVTPAPVIRTPAERPHRRGPM